MKRFCFMLSLILIGISFAGESLSNKTVVATSLQATNYISVVKKDDVQCKAITKSGKLCKRKKTNNSEYCKQHKLIEEKKRQKAQ